MKCKMSFIFIYVAATIICFGCEHVEGAYRSTAAFVRESFEKREASRRAPSPGGLPIRLDHRYR